MEIIVKTLKGMEEMLAQEIRELGGQKVQILKRAVRCHGDLELVYTLNFRLRLALSVLLPVRKWKALNYKEIYEETMNIPWEDYLSVDSTFAIRISSFSKYFKNSYYSLQRVKDAVADYFLERYDRRPSVDKEDPDVWLNIHINQQMVEIQLDSSGEPLYKRGGEKQRGYAPLNEILASGLIQMSGWTPDHNIYDPMCGSGTFILEALSLAHGTPSQLHRRHFNFMNWSNFDEALWTQVRQEKPTQEVTSHFFASDLDDDAVHNTTSNIKTYGWSESAYLWKSDFFKVYMGSKPGFMFINPPYNERLSLHEAKSWYIRLGKILKSRYCGWKICILSADSQNLKHIGLKPTRKVALRNGGLDVMVFFIDIFR